MDKLRSHAQVKVHVENENLIMYGSSNESSGCVLRGVMNLQLQETTKIKSIGLELTGKLTISWTEGVGNGHDRLFKEEKTILHHQWTFLPKEQKMHILNNGSYTYEFELILPGDLTESTYVPNFYTVQYQLKATVERSTFLPNIVTRKLIHISRQLLPFMSPEFLEPVRIANQWTNKLDYEITLPTKIYTHGDQIPISVRITPLTDTLRVRHLSCTLKEYMICRGGGSNGFLNTRPRAHGRVLFSCRDDKFGKDNSNSTGNFIEWQKTQNIKLSSSHQEIQCDMQNDAIRIRHKIKFVLSLINADGHISELRAALPITICAINNAGLPAYEETWRTLPYDPASMLALLYRQNGSSTNVITPLLPSYNSIFAPCANEQHEQVSGPPTYDEILPCVASQ